jgi:hypothetical protein
MYSMVPQLSQFQQSAVATPIWSLWAGQYLLMKEKAVLVEPDVRLLSRTCCE